MQISTGFRVIKRDLNRDKLSTGKGKERLIKGLRSLTHNCGGVSTLPVCFHFPLEEFMASRVDTENSFEW